MGRHFDHHRNARPPEVYIRRPAAAARALQLELSAGELAGPDLAALLEPASCSRCHYPVSAAERTLNRCNTCGGALFGPR